MQMSCFALSTNNPPWQAWLLSPSTYPCTWLGHAQVLSGKCLTESSLILKGLQMPPHGGTCHGCKGEKRWLWEHRGPVYRPPFCFIESCWSDQVRNCKLWNSCLNHVVKYFILYLSHVPFPVEMGVGDGKLRLHESSLDINLDSRASRYPEFKNKFRGCTRKFISNSTAT